MRLTTQMLAAIPKVPAIYVMYGGRGRAEHVAYVGLAESLRRRLTQHLVRRDGSVPIGTSAVCLNPECLTMVRWWTDPDFRDRVVLEAAEQVAFHHFEPALRSRGKVSAEAGHLASQPEFEDRMYRLFTLPESGRLVLPSLHEVVRQLEALQRRVKKLELRLDAQERGSRRQASPPAKG